MPLINGMKMACEPCIRGHRSTKCTHANERLMVPVRKPGRPLSACPHLRDQICGCNIVTAAIPLKQTCQCSSSTQPLHDGSFLSKVTPTSAETPISPSKPTFKINKIPKKNSSNKKLSYKANLDLMSTNQMNIHLKSGTEHKKPVHSSNGSLGSLDSQFADNRGHFSHLHTHGCSLAFGLGETCQKNGDNQPRIEKSKNEHHCNTNNPSSARPNSLPSEYTQCSNDTGPVNSHLSKRIHDTNVLPEDAVICCCILTNGHRTNSYSANRPLSLNNKTIPENGVKLNRKSPCCMMKRRDYHDPLNSDCSLGMSQAEINNYGPREGSLTLGQETLSPTGAHIPSHDGSDYTDPYTSLNLYSSLNNPIFSYPAYGSFSNPLEASVWRQNQENVFCQPQDLTQISPLNNTSNASGIISTNQTCICGDNCQCVGCAVHPYNDATQEYVISAWQSISMENDSSDCYPNDQLNTNENKSASLQQIVETGNSSNLLAPSSLSGNDEEQNLPENDFLFVNYPIPSEGCQDSSFGFSCTGNCSK